MAFKILITNFFTALERLQLFLKKNKKKKQHTIIRGFNLPSGRSCAKYHLFEKEEEKKKNLPETSPRSLLFSLSTEQLRELQETA